MRLGSPLGSSRERTSMYSAIRSPKVSKISLLKLLAALATQAFCYDYYTPNAHTKYNLVKYKNCYTANNTSDIILLYCGSNGSPCSYRKASGDLLTCPAVKSRKKEGARNTPALIRMAGLSVCITSPASSDAGRLQI
jgi:hypothetical protein